jgi:4'-phosphopantetheinyl transferase
MFDFPRIKLTKDNALIFTAHLPSINQHQQELWQSLSEQEKTQAKRFINNYLRDRYVMSHGLLRYLLSFYAERAPQDIQYSVNQFGKPFLENNKNQIQFNMSHSKDYAAYIIALGDPIGIDIEWKDKDINLQEISEFVLSPTEIINFNQLSAEEKFHAFYDVWTKKEAIIKAIGQGLSYPIKTIEIMNFTDNNKARYATNGTTFYCSNLRGLDNYTGTAALTHKFSQLIQVDLVSHQMIHINEGILRDDHRKTL